MEQESQMFNVDKSKATNINNVTFFNKETVIIKEGQRRKVIFGNMEKQEKTWYQTLQPYLAKVATTTGVAATTATQGAFTLLKNGFWWAYDQLVNNLIPYTAEKLPQILFVVKKQELKNNQCHTSESFNVLGIDSQDYQSMKKHQKNKIKVVIPLGTQYDPQFAQFLKKQKFVENNSFPIDLETDQEQKVKQQSFMIPSQTFEQLFETVNQKYKNQKLKPTIPKVFYKMKDCCIFQLQGKNTIQYDLLDNIQRHEKSQSGYIVLPDKLPKRKSSEEEEKNSQKKVQKKQQKTKELIQQIKTKPMKKKVDCTKNVQVDTKITQIKNQEQQLYLA